MITIELTDVESDILLTGLTNTVDEMTEEIERLTKIETAFESIRNKIRNGQNETTINTNTTDSNNSMPSV